jgi:competence protein ComEC
MILAWLSAAFLGGVLIGTWITAPSPLLLALAGASILISYLLRLRKRSSLFLLAAALALGMGRTPHAAGPPSPGDLSYYNGSRVTLRGTVVAEPDVRDTGINYVISVDAVTMQGRARPVSGKLELHTPRSQPLDYGDAVSLTGSLLTPTNGPTVPYRDVLARQGIHSEMRFPRVLDLGPGQAGWLGWIVPLRQHLENGIDAWLPEPEAALLIAITLGAHSASLGSLTPILISTGLIHIIAISGIKVAMVAGTLYELARRLHRRFLAMALALAGLLFYVLLTGATASGQRAGLMWAMVFLAAYLGRRTVTLVSLGFVAALMVALDPGLLWDTGFLMSTLGTFSIVAFAEPLTTVFRYVPSPFGGAFPLPLADLIRAVSAPFLVAFAVTLAAQVGTLPVVIAGFHVISIMGPVANMLVLPLLPIMIVLGFVLGFCSGVAVLAAPVADLSYTLTHAVAWLATSLASIHTALPAGAFSPFVSALYYAALLALARFILRRADWAPVGRRPLVGRELALGLLVAATALTATAVFAQDRPHARLYWLGTGEAMLVRSDGMTALIDGSPRPFTLLERLGQVLPYRDRTIDLVIVTDPRAGNVTGLQDVLQHYVVSEVLDVGAEYPSATYARWRAGLRSRHILAYMLRTGASVSVGAVQITAIGPDALYSNPRDCVGMLRLSVAGRSYLLAGAASPREQLEAVFRPVNLRATTLVLDAGQQLVPAFWRTVRPSLIMSPSKPPFAVSSLRLLDNHTAWTDL